MNQTTPQIETNLPTPQPLGEHRWTWVEVLLITVFTVAILLIGIFMINLLLPESILGSSPTENASLSVTVLATLLEGVAILTSYFLVARFRGPLRWRQLGFRWPGWLWMVSAGILTVAAVPLIGLIALIVQYLLGMPLDNPQLDVLVPDQFSLPGAVAMLLVGGFIVPIAEEIFFRGVLFRWLRQHWPSWAAILVSSLIFGALHGEISVAAATAFMGVLMAWIYEQSGSLWPAIFIHITNNAVKLFLLYALLATGIEIPAGF